MTSQWDRLCAILELAEKLPAKDKSTYLQSALIALAYESRVTIAARDLKKLTKDTPSNQLVAPSLPKCCSN